MMYLAMCSLFLRQKLKLVAENTLFILSNTSAVAVNVRSTVAEDWRRDISRIMRPFTSSSCTAAKAGSEIIVLYNVKSILTDNSI